MQQQHHGVITIEITTQKVIKGLLYVSRFTVFRVRPATLYLMIYAIKEHLQNELFKTYNTTAKK